ncbi:MAG: hypothetical protein EVA87_07605 [Rhodospirillaceae bacterium]|nr:MAG: hypothetical protein EVA87_07605 [Rhodospirillaceae bacterium]
MSKLGEAEKRLQRAVTALEQAAVARSGGGTAESEEAADVEIEAAQARIAELQAVNASVAEKLDGAILRVKKILGS